MRFLLPLLVVAGFAAAAAAVAELAVVEVHGSHYDIGFQIGKRFKTEITHRFNTDAGMAKVLSYIKTRTGLSAFEAFSHTVHTMYPHYVEEVRGMADGAEIAFNTMMTANMMAELSSLAQLPGITDCSDILIKTADHTLIGHNEDNDNGTLTTSFIVVAHIHGNDSEATSYTSMHYPGQLAGDSFGFNEHGLVFTTNALFPLNGVVGGIPRIFLGRDLLNARTVDDMLIRINRAQQRASGFSINAVSVHDGRLFNMELAPQDFSVHEIRGSTAHFNQYLALNNPHRFEPSSDHRLARYNAMPKPQNIHDILQVLGDNQDAEYPIYRNGEAPDTSIVTIATAVFDIRERTMSVYTSNPKLAGGPTMVFPIKSHREE